MKWTSGSQFSTIFHLLYYWIDDPIGRCEITDIYTELKRVEGNGRKVGTLTVIINVTLLMSRLHLPYIKVYLQVAKGV